MDRITHIETELQKALLTILSTTTLPGDYTYYNDVTVVNVDDEVIADERGDYPTVCIYLDPDEKIISGEQRAFRSKLTFKLVCSVANDDIVDSPRFEINQKMNEMLSDLKALFSHNYHINETVDITNMKTSRREYNTNGDSIRAGDLIVTIECIYTQSRINPNKNCSQ